MKMKILTSIVEHKNQIYHAWMKVHDGLNLEIDGDLNLVLSISQTGVLEQDIRVSMRAKKRFERLEEPTSTRHKKI